MKIAANNKNIDNDIAAPNMSPLTYQSTEESG